jgi:hypothetical protein
MWQGIIFVINNLICYFFKGEVVKCNLIWQKKNKRSLAALENISILTVSLLFVLYFNPCKDNVIINGFPRTYLCVENKNSKFPSRAKSLRANLYRGAESVPASLGASPV